MGHSVLKTERGIALIAAVFLIVVFGFLGIAVVSLVGTQGFSAMNEVKSDQAFFVAEGGTEFSQRFLAQNLQWYRSTVDPILIPATNLGAGSFNVSVNLPATMLRTRIPDDTSIAPIRVYTTNRFPASGFLQIEEDLTGDAEFVFYSGIVGNTFTGISRGQTVDGVSNGASAHERGHRVYPVTTLTVALANSCAAPASFTVAAHPKFLGAGTVNIDEEEISYTGSTIAGGTMTFTGVTRCQNGTASAPHNNGRPVTPLLAEGTLPDLEAEIISTGTVSLAAVGNAARSVRKTVQR
ncbi:MAG: hypothetical protein MCM46_11765 [Candidatus Manganitrophus sp. SB1]|nr:hypothetical protein [Candidatus Manganitrophus morganii]